MSLFSFTHTFSTDAYQDLQFLSASEDGSFILAFDDFYDKKITLIQQVNDEFFFQDVPSNLILRYHKYRDIVMKKTKKQAEIWIRSFDQLSRISVQLPLSEKKITVQDYTHNSSIRAIGRHPKQNQIVLLDDDSLFMMNNNYDIPFTTDRSYIIEESLKIVERKGRIFYYIFFLTEAPYIDQMQIIMIEENQFLASYTQHKNIVKKISAKYIKDIHYSQDQLLAVVIFDSYSDVDQYFINAEDLSSVSIQSNQLAQQWQFFMFSKRQRKLAFIDKYGFCYVDYQIGSYIKLNTQTQSCLQHVEIKKVMEFQFQEEIYTIVQSDQSLSIYDENFHNLGAVDESFSDFHVTNSGNIIVQDSQSIEVFKIISILPIIIVFSIIGIILFLILIAYFLKKYLQFQGQARQEANHERQQSERQFKVMKNMDKETIEDFCCICLNKNCNSFLPCQHRFHEKCIKEC